MGNPTTIHQPVGTTLLLLLITLMAAGCSGMKLERPLQVHENDWPVSGRTAARDGSASTTVIPPLTLDWEQDISAGVGGSSPVVIDSVIFIGTMRGELHAINARTGKRLGWVSLGDAIEGAPTVDGGLAVVGVTNSRESLVALDLVTGKIQWRRSYGDIEMTPLISDNRIYFGTPSGQFFCVDKGTGNQLWKFEIPSNIRLKGIRSSPAGADSTVVFGGEDGVVYALNTGTGKERWKYQTNGPINATPSIANGTVFIGNIPGRVHAIDLHTGKIRWIAEAGSAIHGSALLHDGLTIIGSTGGSLFAFRQDSGSVAWKSECGGPINSGAVAAGNYIFVGTLRRELLVLQEADGSVVWRKDVGGRIKTSPAAAYGRIFVATDDREVLSFRGSTQ